MAFEFILSFAYTLLFVYIILKAGFFKNTSLPKTWLVIAFVSKIMAGLLLSLIYTKYYTDRNTADVFKFFDDSKVLFKILKTNPLDFIKIVFHVNSNSSEVVSYTNELKWWYNRDILFNDNQTMIVLNTLFRCFSIGNYSVHVVFINFLSFTGLVALFRVFQSQVKNKSKEIFWLVMFLPSVLIWGSGLLKDSLLLFALGTLLYFFNKLVKKEISVKNLFSCFIAVILLVFTKLYVLLILLPALIAWPWAAQDKGFIIAIKFLACYALYFLIVFNIGNVNDKYDVADMLYYKQQSFYSLADSTKAQSIIEIPKFNATGASIIYHAPASVMRVLLRPSLLDSHSPLILLVAVENLFLLFLLLFSTILYKRNNTTTAPMLWLSVFFVLCLFALTGLITPVLGAMVRYKVPALPFVVFIIVSLYEKDKLFRFFPYLKKLM